MLTKLRIRNFKRLDEVEVELGQAVVLIGPNNSGKTTALQALALWELGVKRWNEKRKGKGTPEKRPGVTLNRRDLVSLPVPRTNLLWREQHVRDVQRTEGKTQTQNVRIDLIVEGVTNDKAWQCGMEFDYANDESLYCRPLRLSEQRDPERMPVPPECDAVHVAFLPPMSGLASNETRLDPGAINVRIGEGRTAEVLRNLCFAIFSDHKDRWQQVSRRIKELFGVELDAPEYIPERGEIALTYREHGSSLDISASGRGLQQTLLLLAYMHANPGAVLLLDEPDAHLEILRQRQIYQLLTDVAHANGNQIIAASHSEVLLNEAADRDVVVAFVGRPHRIDDRGSQVLKALKEIGFDQYYLAEQTGWVLYLEGSTDLAILRAFARTAGHRAAGEALERPFVHYTANQPNEVRKHFYGVREAAPDLAGLAVFDRLERPLPKDVGAATVVWRRREIENYLCFPDVLQRYVQTTAAAELARVPLFGQAETEQRAKAMDEAVREVERALTTLGKGSPWEGDCKVSDEFLTPVFAAFFQKLGLPNVMEKSNFHELARLVPKEKIDPEVIRVLDMIAETAAAAQARRGAER